jgi:hypothetical protein
VAFDAGGRYNHLQPVEDDRLDGVCMNDTSLLLKAYYEAVYELLEEAREGLRRSIGELLSEEVEVRGFEGFDDERLQAYREACIAFIEERIETFNPIGYQYTFGRCSAQEAFDLELQLNWYDAREEFEILAQTAQKKADLGITDDNLSIFAHEMIRELGVFPDKSIIETYQAKPTLQKLPDYIVAVAIEEAAGRA